LDAFVTLSLFIWSYRKRVQTKGTLMEVTYICCELACAMSKEVWNLKFMAALSPILIADLCTEVMSKNRAKFGETK
jgi:hypothetical protein